MLLLHIIICKNILMYDYNYYKLILISSHIIIKRSAPGGNTSDLKVSSLLNGNTKRRSEFIQTIFHNGVY